jgi:hypothetical protein
MADDKLLQGFESFEFTSTAAYTKEPFVSVSRNGRIYFNVAVCRQIEAERFAFVELLFNAETRRIAMRFTPTGSRKPAGAWELRSYDEGTQQILARPFIETYGISVTPAQKLSIEWHEDEKILLTSEVLLEEADDE